MLLLLLLAATACKGGFGADPSGAGHSLQGVVEFDETALAFEIGGRLATVAVKEGDVLTAESVVATLDDELVRTEIAARSREAAALRAQVALADAGARKEDLAALGARVRAAKATEALLTKQAARQRSLRERGVSTDAVLDDLEGQLARATAERESLDSQYGSMKRGVRPEERDTLLARAEGADATLKLTEQRLARHVLHAGVAGEVLEVSVEPSEVVGAGTAVATLGNTAHPFVDVFVPQGKIAGIRVGTKAEVRVDSLPDPVAGAVEFVSRTTEFTPRYLFSEKERPSLVIRVRVRLDDAKGALHAGVPAFVTLAGGAGTAP